MVRIIFFILCINVVAYGQHNSQGGGKFLDSASILTYELSDSSIIFNKLMYVNGPKLIGNPAATYDSLKVITLGTNLSFSNDTLNSVSNNADSSILFKKLRYVNGPKLIGNPAATYDSLKYIKLGTNLSFSNDTLNAAGGSTNVVQNGNSFAAGMTIGTNDNNILNLETNGVTRLSINSGATTGGELTTTNVTALGAALVNTFTMRTNSSGSTTAGFGGNILFQGESSTTDNQDMATIGAYWNTATHASRGAYISFKLVKNAAAPIEYFLISQNGAGEIKVGNGTRVTMTTANLTTETAYTLGNSSSDITLGGSSGRAVMQSSANSATACLINGSNTTTPCLTLGNTGYTGTADTKNMLYTSVPYTAASGSGYVNCITLEPVYNLTGTASAMQSGIKINPTLTSLTAATFAGINLPYSHANSYGIYQSGTAKNILTGKLSLGVNSAPTANLMLAAGTATANTAPLKFTSGTNLTTPEAGAVECDASNLYFTNNATIRFTLAKLLSATATLDFGSTLTGTSNDLTTTITGAADGDEIILGVPNAAMNANSSYTAWVSSTNTITIRLNNYSTGSIDPASASFNVSVIKR